jgi:hypothetical protein
MAENTTVITSSVATATSQHKRDVSEILRRLNPSISRMLALVDGSKLDANGNVAYGGRGMIKKRSVNRMDPECFVFTPAEMSITATGGSATTANVADTTIFGTDDVIYNATTDQIAIVNTLTSSTVLTVTAVTGGTWSCTSGDVIKRLASTYEEGTRRYNTISRENTRVITYLQIIREGYGIANTAKSFEQYINESMKDQYAKNKMDEFMRKAESSFLFSKQATAGTTSTTIGGTAYPLYTMKGVSSWAASTVDLSGAFSHDVWNTSMYESMPDTLNGDETIYAIMGKKIAGTMNQWAANSYLVAGENSGEMKFGKKIKTYIMGGALEVEPIVHNEFNTGEWNDAIMLVQSSDLEYLYYKGLDINIRDNAEMNDEMAEKSVIECAIGLNSKSNGANIKVFKNCLSA